MKLPHTSHPVQRAPAVFYAPAAVNPSQVQPQAGKWESGTPGKNSGKCECTLNKRTGHWIPTSNNCRYLGVPQCTNTGKCSCVRKGDQQLSGAAQDITAVQGLMQAINV